MTTLTIHGSKSQYLGEKDPYFETNYSIAFRKVITIVLQSLMNH